MNIRHLLRPMWRRKLRSSYSFNQSSAHRMQTTLTMVAQTRDQELSCDEVYALLDVFADRVSRGEDVAKLMPLVHHHLQMCPDCREEFAALLRSIESTPA